MPEVRDVFLATRLHDEKNLKFIDEALKSGRIDDAAHTYLTNLYTDSMDCFRDVFMSIGKCFGAPKAAVHVYDYETDSIFTQVAFGGGNDGVDVDESGPTV